MIKIKIEQGGYAQELFCGRADVQIEKPTMSELACGLTHGSRFQISGKLIDVQPPPQLQPSYGDMRSVDMKLNDMGILDWISRRLDGDLNCLHLTKEGVEFVAEFNEPGTIVLPEVRGADLRAVLRTLAEADTKSGMRPPLCFWCEGGPVDPECPTCKVRGYEWHRARAERPVVRV